MSGRARRTAAAAFVLVASLGNVSSATAAAPYDFAGSEFVLHLSAAAVQAQADVPRTIATSVGYSSVRLTKEVLERYGYCQAVGAGAHLVENGLLEDSGAPYPGNQQGGLRNPTEARNTAPNLSPGEPGTRPRQVPDEAYARRMLREVGLGEERYLWAASCEYDTAGTATGNLQEATSAAGSTTSGQLDKTTGTYVGTSRAFVAGLTTPSGTVEALSSTVKVTHRAGNRPVLDYRIAANGGTLAAGSSVPVDQLTEQFNEQVRENAPALAEIGQLGLTLVGPTESEPDDHARRVVHFPFVEVSAGLKAREGGIGQGQRVRLLTVAYEGMNQGAVGQRGGNGR